VRDPGVFRGHVVDFIAYLDWFVGNVADIAIVVAAGMLMLLAPPGIRLDGPREGRGEASPEDEAHAPEAADAPEVPGGDAPPAAPADPATEAPGRRDG